MTRKDYEAIASVVSYVGDMYQSQQNEYEAILTLAEGLADTLARDNARFDRSRFLEACGFGI
jgi:hypothetical protein